MEYEKYLTCIWYLASYKEFFIYKLNKNTINRWLFYHTWPYFQGKEQRHKKTWKRFKVAKLLSSPGTMILALLPLNPTLSALLKTRKETEKRTEKRVLPAFLKD